MTTFEYLKPEALPALVAAAKADDHAVIAATHIVKKNGRIVGYLSFNSLPTVLLWLDTKETTQNDSYQVQNFFETLATPFGGVCVPVPTKSPFYPLMHKAGYQNMGEGSVFMKPL